MANDTERDRVSAMKPAPLDELIPAPWSTGRRLALWLVFGVAVAATILTVRSGLVGPQLAHDSGWGSSVDATDPTRLVGERLLPLRNDGWIEVAVLDVTLPRIEGVTWGEPGGVPATLEPGEVHEVAIPFVADGCGLDVGGYDRFEILADSGIAPARVVTVPAPGSSDPTTRVGYVDEEGRELTLPTWPDQPPSWILDTISAPCTTPPEGAA